MALPDFWLFAPKYLQAAAVSCRVPEPQLTRAHLQLVRAHLLAVD